MRIPNNVFFQAKIIKQNSEVPQCPYKRFFVLPSFFAKLAKETN